MHKRRSLVVMLALSAFLALGLAACGDDDSTDSSSGSGSDSEKEVKGSDTIQIKYLDYAYSVSGALNQGGTIEFENTGKELHMMFVGKLKAGKTLDDVKGVLDQAFSGGDEGGGDSRTTETTAASRSQAETTVPEGGGGDQGGGDENPLAGVMDEIGIPWNVLTPGVSAAVTVPSLAPAKYAILCFFDQEGTGKPHASLGMVNQFEVVKGDAVKEPTADVTYKVAPGKAPDGPATLSAGKHTLKFEQDGDADELEPNVGHLDDGKSYTEVDAVFEKLYGGDNPPPKGAGQQIPADVFIGGDFLGAPYYYLTMDFVPGNWVITAEDSEDDDDPAIPKELLELKVS